MAIRHLPMLELPQPRIINVASVPMRSPFRYPGGKTWLIPYVRQWLNSCEETPCELIEPFAGGAIVGLTAAFEKLVRAVTLVELDHDVASVWHTIVNGQGVWLAEAIAGFEMSHESVDRLLGSGYDEIRDRALATIIRNRISRGGILAPGAGVVKNGENGKGIHSRWYPDTLRKRILDIVSIRDRVRFIEGDGIGFLRDNSHRRDVVFFIDPPYTLAGRRLYTHSVIDHPALFDLVATLSGDFLMTYDNAPEIRLFAAEHDFQVREVPMKSTHHLQKTELLIGRDLRWLDR